MFTYSHSLFHASLDNRSATLETEAISAEGNAVAAMEGAQAAGAGSAVGLMVGKNAKVDNVQIIIGTG